MFNDSFSYWFSLGTSICRTWIIRLLWIMHNGQRTALTYKLSEWNISSQLQTRMDSWWLTWNITRSNRYERWTRNVQQLKRKFMLLLTLVFIFFERFSRSRKMKRAAKDRGKPREREWTFGRKRKKAAWRRRECGILLRRHAVCGDTVCLSLQWWIDSISVFRWSIIIWCCCSAYRKWIQQSEIVRKSYCFVLWFEIKSLPF